MSILFHIIKYSFHILYEQETRLFDIYMINVKLLNMNLIQFIK